MDLPVVNHEDYFAKIGDDHKFPIKKFGELASYLIKKKIVTKFHKPYPCSDVRFGFFFVIFYLILRIGLPFTHASKASIICV